MNDEKNSVIRSVFLIQCVYLQLFYDKTVIDYGEFFRQRA